MLGIKIKKKKPKYKKLKNKRINPLITQDIGIKAGIGINEFNTRDLTLNFMIIPSTTFYIRNRYNMFNYGVRIGGVIGTITELDNFTKRNNFESYDFGIGLSFNPIVVKLAGVSIGLSNIELVYNVIKKSFILGYGISLSVCLFRYN